MYPVLTKAIFDHEKVDVRGGKFLYGNDPVGEDFYDEFSPPKQFVGRCSDDNLTKQIIQYCVKKTTNERQSVLLADEKPVRSVRTRRAVVQFDTIEKLANDTHRAGMSESPIIKVEDDMQMTVLLKAPKDIALQITPRVGDTITGGIELVYRPAQTIAFRGWVERLVCLNGAKTQENVFSWQSDGDIPSEQTDFIARNFSYGIAHISRFAKQAKKMAELKIANPEKVLELYAKNMKIPPELVPALVENFELEPTLTEWGVFNAITRAATHDKRFEKIADNLQLSCGEWVKNYDRVTASVPREIARLF